MNFISTHALPCAVSCQHTSFPFNTAPPAGLLHATCAHYHNIILRLLSHRMLTHLSQHLLPNGTCQSGDRIPSNGYLLADVPALPPLPPNSLQVLASVSGGDAVLAPRMLSFAPPSPPPLDLDSLEDGQEAILLELGRRSGRGRGRGRGRGGPAAAARVPAPIAPPPTLKHEDLSTSPLMAPGVSNSLGIAVGPSFRVRIGERAITDGLCALLQGMLQPQVSQPPLTTSSLLSLLQKMAPPALTLGRTAAPSWLQDNTQQVARMHVGLCSFHT